MKRLFKFYLKSLVKTFKYITLADNKLKVIWFKYLISPKNKIWLLITNKFKIMGKISHLQSFKIRKQILLLKKLNLIL